MAPDRGFRWRSAFAKLIKIFHIAKMLKINYERLWNNYSVFVCLGDYRWGILVRVRLGFFITELADGAQKKMIWD
ncbi:MAG: hypothetical protein K2I92_03295, partial [Muribaculaceae bacterium]|nr:hypothetical protein [Muribaculaceae bacterium]